MVLVLMDSYHVLVRAVRHHTTQSVTDSGR
jgi:hypothetical protein